MVGRNSFQFYFILIMSNRATIYFLPSWFLSFFFFLKNIAAFMFFS